MKTRLIFHVHNQMGADEADIDIFDVIGDSWDGTTAKDFVRELRGLNVSRINLHINSPGGYVDEGLAMYNAIRQHPAEVTALVESVAASAASFVAMAADRVVIAKTAKMTIHDAWGVVFGNARDCRAQAEVLEEESDNIAGIYAEKTGGSVDEWRAAMQANDGMGTTYRGQEAVDAGLADELMAAPGRKNLMPMRAVAQLALQERRLTNAGRPMSQANLDSMHEALDLLMNLHGAVCDLDLQCPLGASNQVRRGQRNQVPGTTSTITATLGACLYDALTDQIQDWLEDGVISMDEFLPLSTMITDLVGAMDRSLDELELADRVIPGADDDSAMPWMRAGRGSLDAALPPHDVGTAPEEEAWSAPSLSDFTDAGSWDELSDAEKRRIARHAVWEDNDPPKTFGELKGFHHAPSKSGVGKAVWRAVSSGRMAQMEQYDDQGVQKHLGGHYHQFGKTPPWEEDNADHLQQLVAAIKSGAKAATQEVFA